MYVKLGTSTFSRSHLGLYSMHPFNWENRKGVGKGSWGSNGGGVGKGEKE